MNAAPEVPDRDSRKTGGRAARRAGGGGRGGRVGGRGEVARELGDRLERAARLAGYEWWWTATSTAIGAERGTVPLVGALEGLAEALRSGHDPDVVVGGDGPELAVEVAGEWLAAGVAPCDVGPWVRAGCWRPAAARAMTDAGIRPAQLLRDDVAPRHLVDSVPAWPIPLARAVADDEMSVAAALAHLRGLADSFRVQVERVGRSWRVRVEGSGDAVEGDVPNLGGVEAWARTAIARHRGEEADGVYLATDVQLPAPIQDRIDHAAQLRKEAEHPASDPAARRLALDGARSEIRAAARDLAALGVTVADVAELLQVTTREAHALLRDP